MVSSTRVSASSGSHLLYFKLCNLEIKQRTGLVFIANPLAYLVPRITALLNISGGGVEFRFVFIDEVLLQEFTFFRILYVYDGANFKKGRR